MKFIHPNVLDHICLKKKFSWILYCKQEVAFIDSFTKHQRSMVSLSTYASSEAKTNSTKRLQVPTCKDQDLMNCDICCWRFLQHWNESMWFYVVINHAKERESCFHHMFKLVCTKLKYKICIPIEICLYRYSRVKEPLESVHEHL